jgi:hypothetical protein
MPDIYRNTSLNNSPQITILSYVVERDEVISADKEQIYCRHVRTDEFMDKDIMSARKKACDYFREESSRLKPELKNAGNDDSRHLGLMLYYTFKKNAPDKSGGCSGWERFYILDGEDRSALELLDRLQEEYYHLLGAGVVFDSIEIEMKGELYFIALGGLFEIGKQEKRF